MRDRYDVAIVGYGPVGQTLAILLAQRGWHVVVFEKQPAAYPLPRAVHLDHEVARVLQAAGIGEALAEGVEVADTYEWRNAEGQVLLRFESDPVGISGWPEANMFAQPDLERLLDARARALPTVEIHRGSEVVGIDQRDAGVALEVRAQASPAGDGTRADAAGEPARFTVHAKYVVGCDGANSFVRSQLGANVTDLGFFFDWLIVDVRPHQPKQWCPLNIQVCDPRRPTTLVSGGKGRRRWEFMCLPDESVEDLNSEATAWRLLAPWDTTPENATLERHAVYRFQARWVDTWRKGRVLIAGDAAHQMPPFAGQGMCSGIRDAANLAWKLDLVLAGKANDSLLDTYAGERVAHVAMLIGFSMELGKVICMADPAEAAARDAAMATAAAEGQALKPPRSLSLGAGVLRGGDPRAGELFVQGRVRSGGRAGLFDDVVGRGWTLLARDRDPLRELSPAAAEFFAALGGISAHVGTSAPIADVDGVYERWFDDAGVDVVLQRPDFYLFGTATGRGGAGELVEQLQRALRSPSQQSA